MRDKLQKLKSLFGRMTEGPWMVADSCSWRRIVHAYRNSPVIQPTTQQSDGHPDLLASRHDLDGLCVAVNEMPKFVEALEELDALCVKEGDTIPTARIREILDRVCAERQKGA